MRTRSSTKKIQAESLLRERIEENVCSKCNSGVISSFDSTYKVSLLCKVCYENVSQLSSTDKQCDYSGKCIGITSFTFIRKLVNSFKCLPFFHLSILAACCVCFLISYTIFKHFESGSTNVKCKDVGTILADVLCLRTEFPNQYDGIWFDFAAGIDSVVNTDPARPTTFLLLHEDGAQSVASSLAERVMPLAAGCMNGKMLRLEAERLGQELSSDSGRLLTEYRDKIEAAKVVLVDNFHRLPGALAKQFHHLCDFHQPVVGRVVYVFLMRVDYLPTETNKTAAAEKALYELWSPHLHHYLLDPLITRITGNVIRIAR